MLVKTAIAVLSAMHPKHIILAIHLKNTTCAQIARDLGRSKATVSDTIYGRKKSCHVVRRICEVTGLDPNDCWPGKYPEFEFLPIQYPKLASEEARA
ncbi:MAG: helix-turn-helix domain-containing protein [Burkholderia gladioli]